MLKLKVVKTPCWAEKPWQQIANLAVGTAVEFVRTEKPRNIPNENCTKHLNVAKCRNIVVSAFGKEFTTNICMEEAKYYFSMVEHNHGKAL